MRMSRLSGSRGGMGRAASRRLRDGPGVGGAAGLSSSREGGGRRVASVSADILILPS